MNKFLIRENMMILRQKNHEQPEDRINMDKFLEKLKDKGIKWTKKFNKKRKN